MCGSRLGHISKHVCFVRTYAPNMSASFYDQCDRQTRNPASAKSALYEAAPTAAIPRYEPGAFLALRMSLSRLTRMLCGEAASFLSGRSFALPWICPTCAAATEKKEKGKQNVKGKRFPSLSPSCVFSFPPGESSPGALKRIARRTYPGCLRRRRPPGLTNVSLARRVLSARDRHVGSDVDVVLNRAVRAPGRRYLLRLVEISPSPEEADVPTDWTRVSAES